jgi:hypothetical protein
MSMQRAIGLRKGEWMHKAAMGCKRMEGKEWCMCVVSRFRKPPKGEGIREKGEAARVVRAPPFHIALTLSFLASSILLHPI